ncbi:gag [Black Syrian hamster retrovirus]|nr:gag [Black Syrian hamster retrovirus]
MGNSGSKGQKMFISILKHMLAERGLNVSDAIAKEFYLFLMKVSPWFPEEGSLTLEDWKRVGREMRRYAEKHGEETIPRQAYPVWLQMREILTEKSDLVLLTEEAASVKDESTCLPAKTYGRTQFDLKPIKTGLDDLNLGTEDEAELKREASEYDSDEDRDHRGRSYPVLRHSKSKSERMRVQKDISKPKRKEYLPPIGFQGALAEAREQGDTSFMFPVIFNGNSDDEDPVWEPLPLKTLKELQHAVKSMGPSAPYTIQVVEMVASQWLTPNDWHQTAKATLSPGDYIVWRTDYEDRCKVTAQNSAGKRGGKITMDMLLGEGAFVTPAEQTKLPKAVLKEITTNAVLAWRAIPPPGTEGNTLAGIQQGNEESYTSFISRLEEVINRMLPAGEGTSILLKQLAWENANTLCKDLIRPIRKTGSIQDYIKVCADASPAVMQGMAYAAAMQGKKFSAFVKQTYGGGNGKNPAPTCFNCGESGHMKKDCKKGGQGGSPKRSPGICPRCKKGRHWRNECHSKFTKDGTRIEDRSREESKN